LAKGGEGGFEKIFPNQSLMIDTLPTNNGNCQYFPSPLTGEGQGGGEIPMEYEDNIFKKG